METITEMAHPLLGSELVGVKEDLKLGQLSFVLFKASVDQYN